MKNSSFYNQLMVLDSTNDEGSYNWTNFMRLSKDSTGKLIKQGNYMTAK